MNTSHIKLPEPTVFGPYSEWPRKRTAGRTRLVATLGGVAGAAVFVHCLAPQIVV